MRLAITLALAALAVTGCARQTELKPAPGNDLPPKPYGAGSWGRCYGEDRRGHALPMEVRLDLTGPMRARYRSCSPVLFTCPGDRGACTWREFNRFRF